jgi:CheY-like chemotaxis protein
VNIEDTQMVILLVDDSRVQRRANEGALVRAGYKVITASDGVEGLKVARSALPDVILLDMMLPKMSGPDVLRELKADPATAHIPVLVLTGLSQTNESKLMSEGAAGFFQKSDHMLEDDSSHLLDAIKRALQSAKKNV